MNKLWLVLKYEYLRHVMRKRFIFALLSIPLFIVLTIGIGFLAVVIQTDQRPAGYVDFSGVFANARQIPTQTDKLLPNTTFTAYLTSEAAEKAMQAGEIQGYFVIRPNYLNTGEVEYFSKDSIKERTTNEFGSFLRYNLASSLPASISTRVVEGPALVMRSLEGASGPDETNFLTFILPFITGLVFVMVINISGSYLVQALIEEKENRTMEIVVTSISPEQLMGGKVIGNLGVGITQLVIWILVGAIGLWFATNNLEFAAGLSIKPQFIFITIFTLIPAFIMVAALMAMAGVTTTDSREAQQVAGMFTLPVVVPYWLLPVLIDSPNSPAAVGLSLFPLTAPVAMPMRAAVTQVPDWQVGLAIGLLVAGAIGAIWLAGRAFRLGMLRYGQRLAWKEIFGRGGAK